MIMLRSVLFNTNLCSTGIRIKINPDIWFYVHYIEIRSSTHVHRNTMPRVPQNNFYTVMTMCLVMDLFKQTERRN